MLRILRDCQGSLTRIEFIKSAKWQEPGPLFFLQNQELLEEIQFTRTRALEVFAVNHEAELIMCTKFNPAMYQCIELRLCLINMNLVPSLALLLKIAQPLLSSFHLTYQLILALPMVECSQV